MLRCLVNIAMGDTKLCQQLYIEIEKIKALFEKQGVLVFKGRDSKQDEKAVHLFQRIDQSDIVYVVAKGGYAGETMARKLLMPLTTEKNFLF